MIGGIAIRYGGIGMHSNKGIASTIIRRRIGSWNGHWAGPHAHPETPTASPKPPRQEAISKETPKRHQRDTKERYQEESIDMESSKVAWGIEVGEFALKAIRVQMVDDEVTVTDFAVIPHQKVLSDPSVSDRAGMIRVTLGAFAQSHAEQIATEPIIMSLPGNVGFARFATIPAVDAKTLRSMIEYEAKQQIPFPIEEVEWDSHVLPADDSGQCAIGIFAVTKERLQELLTLYADCGIEPDVLTLSSVAVYNALNYDLELDEKTEPLACLDIGTNSSDLIVVARGKFWIRTFPIGGSEFTTAIADAFATQNVNYTRAEKIKVDRTPNEKILRARTMAMRRVTGQLIDEIGRSREFYQASNEEIAVKRAFGVGSTLKIPGLRTKIAGDLQMSLERLEEFKRVHLNGPDGADFAAHSINLLTALGLALQGVGLAKVDLNLSPMARIRRKIWKAKTPWFVAAAALLIISALAMFIRVELDQIELARLSEIVARADGTIKQGTSLVSQLNQAQQGTAGGNADNNVLELLKDRNVWPFLVNDTYAALAAARPSAVETGTNPSEILKIPVGDRRLISLQEFSGVPSIDENGQHRIAVSVRVTLTNRDPVRFLNETEGVLDWLKAHKERSDAPYTIDESSVGMPSWTKIIGGQRTEEMPAQNSGSSESESSGGFASGSGSGATKKSSGSGALTKDRSTGPIQDSGTGFRGTIGGADDASASEGDSASGDGSGTAAGGKRRVKTIVVTPDEKLPTVDLAKEAPLPQAPILVKENEAQFEGILKFSVILKSPAAAPPPPTGEGQ